MYVDWTPTLPTPQKNTKLHPNFNNNHVRFYQNPKIYVKNSYCGFHINPEHKNNNFDETFFKIGFLGLNERNS